MIQNCIRRHKNKERKRNHATRLAKWDKTDSESMHIESIQKSKRKKSARVATTEWRSIWKWYLLSITFERDSIWDVHTICWMLRTEPRFFPLFLLDFDFYICSNNPMEVHLNARLFVLWQQMCAANKKVCIVQRNRLDIAAVIRPVCNFMVLAWLGFVLGWNIHNIKPDNSRKRPNEQ